MWNWWRTSGATLVKLPRYSKYAPVLKNSVAMIETPEWRIFLEKDLAAGHYSYVTLGILAKRLATAKPRKMAGTLRSDPQRVQATYRCSHDMIVLARAILAQLDDPFLMRLVDVTNLRLEAYFHKELQLAA